MSPAERTSIYLAEAVGSDSPLERWVHASSTEEALERLVPRVAGWAQDQPDLLRFAGADGARGWVYVSLYRAGAARAGVARPLGTFAVEVRSHGSWLQQRDCEPCEAAQVGVQPDLLHPTRPERCEPPVVLEPTELALDR